MVSHWQPVFSVDAVRSLDFVAGSEQRHAPGSAGKCRRVDARRMNRMVATTITPVYSTRAAAQAIERFASLMLGQSVLYCELFAGR